MGLDRVSLCQEEHEDEVKARLRPQADVLDGGIAPKVWGREGGMSTFQPEPDLEGGEDGAREGPQPPRGAKNEETTRDTA